MQLNYKHKSKNHFNCRLITRFTLFLFIFYGLYTLIDSSFTENSKTKKSFKALRSKDNSLNSYNNNRDSSTMSLLTPNTLKILYGTAWKKDRTKELVYQAIKSGFRAIDTACQPKHYNEPLVGEGIQQAIADKLITREDIFIQTKFTSLNGQDPNNIPYNPKSPLEEQVRQSFDMSLNNLGVDYLDSLVMHSPMRTLKDTIAVWKMFEEFVSSEKVRYIGMSNTYDVNFFKSIYEAATIKPTFLQNRFYPDTGYDVELREFCKEKSIYYQSFWTLTGNPHIVKSALVTKLAEKYGKTREQVFYRFVQQSGIIPLSGTTSTHHMHDDLNLLSFELSSDEIESIDSMLSK